MNREDMDDTSEQKYTDSAFQAPSTPKRRRRVAPEVLPLGLERSDFHTLHLAEMGRDGEDGAFVFKAGNIAQSDETGETDDEEWSTEEDRLLVELVLEKLKLSKSDWQDCARSLGKDRGNVGKRWKSLIGGGEVGLKRKRKPRTELHSTIWR